MNRMAIIFSCLILAVCVANCKNETLRQLAEMKALKCKAGEYHTTVVRNGKIYNYCVPKIKPVKTVQKKQQENSIVLGQDIFARTNGKRFKIGRLEIGAKTIKFISYDTVDVVQICVFNIMGPPQKPNANLKICMTLHGKPDGFSAREVVLPNLFHKSWSFYQVYAIYDFEGSGWQDSGEWYVIDLEKKTTEAYMRTKDRQLKKVK